MKTHNKKMCSHSKCDTKVQLKVCWEFVTDLRRFVLKCWVRNLHFYPHGSVSTLTAKNFTPSPSFWVFFFLFKHGVNRIPRRVCWTGHECTAHKLESIQWGRCWRAAEATGSRSTWLFPFPSVIRYTSLLLQRGSPLVVRDLMQLSSQVVSLAI